MMLPSNSRVLISFCTVLALMLMNTQSIVGQQPDTTWFNRSDSNYGYYVTIAPRNQAQGAIVLLDGYGGDALSMLPETKIPNVAMINNLVTVCIPSGLHLFLDDQHALQIGSILAEVAAKFKINPARFAIGGFSSGGVLALRYAELSHQFPERFLIRPSAVFTGDSPIDLLSLYGASKRELAAKHPGWWTGEARMIIDSLDLHFGALPVAMDNYRRNSPFIASDTAAGNERWLASVAYRTYHDVDIAWQLDNRNRSAYGMNMLDASELVRRLREMGNTDAAFISSKTPGRRSNGQFHPHSWNIIDETDLVAWVKEKLDFYPGDPAKRYNYPAPVGWGKEIIPMPFDFAPGILYNGYEDLWFAPGWGDAKSGEKWAYTLLWWLDEHYVFNETVLKHDLENYFSGLNKRRAIADNDDMSKYFTASAAVKRVAVAPGDEGTYTAIIHIYDAQVTKKPADLYVKIHVKKLQSPGKTMILFEVSGVTMDQPVWKTLDRINAEVEQKKFHP